MLCGTCGTPKHSVGLGDNQRLRCKPCEVERVSQARRDLKARAAAYLGGQCQMCGYDRCIAALEFHHRTGKDFGISHRGLTRSWDKLKVELDKCDLLCANCHRETHAE